MDLLACIVTCKKDRQGIKPNGYECWDVGLSNLRRLIIYALEEISRLTILHLANHRIFIHTE